MVKDFSVFLVGFFSEHHISICGKRLRKKLDSHTRSLIVCCCGTKFPDNIIILNFSIADPWVFLSDPDQLSRSHDFRIRILEANELPIHRIRIHNTHKLKMTFSCAIVEWTWRTRSRCSGLTGSSTRWPPLTIPSSGSSSSRSLRYRTIVVQSQDHCIPVSGPLYSSLRTIVFQSQDHCIPVSGPLYSSLRTIVFQSQDHCIPVSGPLYSSLRTIVFQSQDHCSPVSFQSLSRSTCPSLLLIKAGEESVLLLVTYLRFTNPKAF